VDLDQATGPFPLPAGARQMCGGMDNGSDQYLSYAEFVCDWDLCCASATFEIFIKL
jgi:hypothetical protein